MSVLSEKLEKDDSSSEEYEDDSKENDQNHNNCYQCLTKTKIGNKNTYILHITATSEASCNIAVGTSNNIVEIYRLGENQLAKINTFGTDGTITGIQFSPDNRDLFYCGSNKTIKLWDLRSSEECVLQFSEEAEHAKPLSCFEVSSNNRLLSAGTELHEGESFILFWDVRNVSLMGAYWESHADSITQVKFNPNDPNKLMSGSLDGLINIFDLKHTNEDDALLDSLNTESSIGQLLWFTRKGKDCISCITGTDDIQLWSIDGSAPYAHFRRSAIGYAMIKTCEPDCYIVSNHRTLKDELLVLTGINKSVQCLNTIEKELSPLGLLAGCNQIVRSSFYNQYHNTLLTGGESGLLQLWNISFKM